MLGFFATFIALQVVLFAAELTPWVQQFLVVPWTNALAAISASLVTLFDPNVAATGKVIRSTVNGFAVSIEAGCNGIEATIVPPPRSSRFRRRGASASSDSSPVSSPCRASTSCA
jgi:hypothetical protein